ncbi:hypothetical protein C8J57DRAFT_1511138 [Mycena rebaudengoi]|nr:hypothetical protein C8J57DRAFT_1511138 [Mycena rebaudengoi]
MVQLDSGEEYADANFCELISDLDDNALDLLSTPRCPTYSPTPTHLLAVPPRYSATGFAGSDDSKLATLLTGLKLDPTPAPSTPPRSRTLICRTLKENICRSIAGNTSQGVAHGSVQNLVKTKKPRRKKAAYVVFHGLRPAVCSTWAETRQAQAAFEYAQDRGWTRVCNGRAAEAAICILPTPMLSSELPNPLHGNEALGNEWYIVYHGITPGVYQSLLEALLNTGGVRASLYEGIPNKEDAIDSYQRAVQRGEVSAVLPVYIG